MASKEYSSTNHLILFRWIMFLTFIIGIPMMILGVVFGIIGFVRDYQSYIFNLCLAIAPLLCIVGIIALYFWSNVVVIDEDEGIIFNPRNKEYTIKIDQISYIKYNKTKKGKIRGLLIHGPSFSSLGIRLNAPKIEALAGHLLRLNPGIEVREG